jgi:small subunit ribosomal protein S9
METKKIIKKKEAVISDGKKSKPIAVKKAQGKYVEVVGRRKTAIARVRVHFAGGVQKGFLVTVNDIPFDKYFPLVKQQKVAIAPFAVVESSYETTVLVKGGGYVAQAEAIRLGIARALVAENPTHRSKLKTLGYLKRDPRMVETKKFGKRKARRAQQWRKR